jgi:hypothetical protein
MIDSNGLGQDLSEKLGQFFRISLWMALLASPFLTGTAHVSNVFDARQLIEMSADPNKGARIWPLSRPIS